MPATADRIRTAIEKADRDRRTGQVLWRVRSDDGSIDVRYGDQAQPFFIASATKLYVTAILAQLRTEGALSWDDAIADHLPLSDSEGRDPFGALVSLRQAQDGASSGTDPSTLRQAQGGASSGTVAMTIRSVMAHTSGLADYFEGKRPDGPPTFHRVLAHDFGWDVRDVVEWTTHMKPGTPGKSLYSDTGYQLLGAVIEHVDQRSFADSVRTRVAEPLGLSNTSVFTKADLDTYDRIAPMRFGDTTLRIPLAMASVQADGGIVSTIDEVTTFLDAFFDGRLFPAQLHDEIQTDWHRIFSPFEYGTGIMRFRMSPALTGFRRMPDLVGHGGASGTVMFRAPSAGITVVGSVNQTKHRSLPYRLMVRTVLDATR